MRKRTLRLLSGVLAAASLGLAGQAQADPDVTPTDKPTVDLTAAPEEDDRPVVRALGQVVWVKQGNVMLAPNRQTGEYQVLQSRGSGWLPDFPEQKDKLVATVKDMCDPNKQVPSAMGTTLQEFKSKAGSAAVGAKIQDFCRKVAQFNP